MKEQLSEFLPAALAEFITRASGTAIYRSKLTHFLSTLLRKCTKQNPVRLDARLLHRTYGRDWPTIRNGLLNAGLLTLDRSYRAAGGVKGLSYCMSYGLTAPAMNGERVAVTVRRWKPLRTVRRRRQETVLATLTPGQRYVWDCVQEITVEAGWRTDPELSESARRGLDAIERGDWFVAADRHGRLHHNITNLARPARLWLRLKGEMMLGCDYSQLHPHLILSMLPDSEEREKLRLWLARDLYGRLDPANRKRAKKELNAAINDRIEHERRYPAFLRFAAEFPHAANLVRSLKSVSHADAAKTLQRLESGLIFGEVIARCMTLGIPAVTVHDCVFSAPQDAKTVQREMIEAARRMLGLDIRASAA